MSAPAERFRPSAWFWPIVPVVAALTWALHEAAHFTAGKLLGYSMWVSMNGSGLVEGTYASTTHSVLVAMAGPLVTYTQAVVAWAVLRRRRSGLAYVVLFLALFMRLAAFAVGISHPNDEARASLDLGFPVWLIPSVACVVLLALTVSRARALRVGWRTNVLLYVVVSVFTATIVLTDPIVGRLIAS